MLIFYNVDMQVDPDISDASDRGREVANDLPALWALQSSGGGIRMSVGPGIGVATSSTSKLVRLVLAANWRVRADMESTDSETGNTELRSSNANTLKADQSPRLAPDIVEFFPGAASYSQQANGGNPRFSGTQESRAVL